MSSLPLIAHLIFRLLPLLFMGCLMAGGPEPLELPPHFKPFAPLVGKTWVGVFPDGKTTDTQIFEWVYAGKFLRNTHHVTNEGRIIYRGETIFAWDRKNEQIVWWYWNDTGGYIIGTLRTGDDKMIVEGENNGPEGQTGKVMGDLSIGDGSWEASQYFFKEGSWHKQFTMTFKPAD